MSTPGPSFRHPINGSPQPTWQGFSWPAFLFTGVWPFVKGLWGHGIVVWLLTIFTAGCAWPVLWFVHGFKGNDWHRDRLLEMGYLSEAQWAERSALPTGTAPSSPAARPARDVVDELTQLARLRETGALTEDEFVAQKRLVLGA